jgi:hypothetical protein
MVQMSACCCSATSCCSIVQSTQNLCCSSIVQTTAAPLLQFDCPNYRRNSAAVRLSELCRTSAAVRLSKIPQNATYTTQGLPAKNNPVSFLKRASLQSCRVGFNKEGCCNVSSSLCPNEMGFLSLLPRLTQVCFKMYMCHLSIS